VLNTSTLKISDYYDYYIIEEENSIALMHDDIRQANFTTKPRFENANCKFYHAQIPKAGKMKKIPS